VSQHAAPVPNQWPRLLAVGGLVAAAFVAGIVTGVVGSGAPAEQAPSNGVLDEAARRIGGQAARPVDAAVLQRAAVEGMLAAVGDRWSRYLGPEDVGSFRDSLEGRYTGVGLWLSQRGSSIVVSGVQPGSPAALAGVLRGDVLDAVDAGAVDGQSLVRVSDLLRGAAGTPVSLALVRGTESLDLTLTRAGVTTDDVTVDRLDGGIAVVRVQEFTRGVGREVRDALAAAGAAPTGVVLDLRRNPGGLLTEAVDVAGAFLDGGPVVSYETRSDGTRTLDALGTGDSLTPLVVLVDRYTASAAEVVAAALQDRSRAVVVGERTFGKGSVQQAADLSDGSAIELTVGRYLTPSGRQIDGVGVEPDVIAESQGSGGDAAAEQRALEVLRGLAAAAGGPG
jgi:carboxyl-terminal processing protease